MRSKKTFVASGVKSRYSLAVKIIDPSINNTKRLDLMQEYWSKFCQSEKQLEEMLCNNTITGEIVDIIEIFVVLKSGVVFKSGYQDFSTEVSIDQLKKCSEPCKGSFFANSSLGLELINITEHGRLSHLKGLQDGNPPTHSTAWKSRKNI